MLTVLHKKLIVLQIITASRAMAGLIFITIALIPQYIKIATGLFIYACSTDIIDGIVARRLKCASKTGGILDLFSDKFLTIISLIYAIARGAPILACSVAILREVFLLSMRNILIDGNPIFPRQRITGTLTIIPIWVGTIVLLQSPKFIEIPSSIVQVYFWIVGILALINLLHKIYKNWNKIISSFAE